MVQQKVLQVVPMDGLSCLKINLLLKRTLKIGMVNWSFSQKISQKYMFFSTLMQKKRKI